MNIKNLTLLLTIVLELSSSTLSGEHISSDGQGGYWTKKGHVSSDGRGGYWTKEGHVAHSVCHKEGVGDFLGGSFDFLKTRSKLNHSADLAVQPSTNSS